jgi:hypothetical protein
MSGAVEILLGIFALIGGLVHLIFGIGGLVTFSGQDATLGAIASSLGNLFTIEGLILLVSGTGLLMGKSWGWKLSVGIIIVGIITSVPVLALGSVGALPALVANVALLYYLSRSSVKSQLGG